MSDSMRSNALQGEQTPSKHSKQVRIVEIVEIAKIVKASAIRIRITYPKQEQGAARLELSRFEHHLLQCRFKEPAKYDLER